MKKIFTILTIILGSLLLSSIQSKASHVMGSDITWKCVQAPNKFEITVTVYRDCNGIQLQTANIDLQAIDCPGYTASIPLATEKGDPWDITPLCKKSCTRCSTGPDGSGNGGSPPGSGSGCAIPLGIEQHVYRAVVDFSSFPPSCCRFKISWTQCCRNGAITTGAGGANFYVESEMNRCVKPCDNSPQFTNPPLAVYCLNHPQTFNMGVNDEDVDAAGNADSLVYSFDDPYDGPGSKIPYTGGYGPKKPLRFDGWPNPDATWNPPSYKGFHLDSATGDLQFKPTKVDQTVFAIKIEAWGKDSLGKPFLKSITRRDMQIVIQACPSNKPPQLTGINGGSETEDHFCVGINKCFTINSFDPDKKDSLTVNWNRGIKGATFTVEKNKKHPRSQFCWKPGPEHVRSYPYTFVVNAADDACPVNGRTTRSYRIYVHPTPVPVVTVDTLPCGDMVYNVKPLTPGSGYSFLWSGDDGLRGNTASVKKHYREPGRYKWAVTIKKNYGKTTCESTDTGSVVIKPYVTIKISNDTAVCVGSTIPLISVKTKLGGGTPADYIYTWSTGKTGKGEANVGTLTNIKITKDTIFWAEVYDPFQKCYNWDTMIVKAKQWPKPDLGPEIRKCTGELVILDPKITEPKSTFEWKNLTNGKVVSTQKLLTVSEQGEYEVTVTDSLKCTGSSKVKVNFNPLVNVQPGTFAACVNEAITVSGGTGSGATWVWRDLLKSGKVVNNSKDYLFISKAPGQMVFLVTASQTIGGVTCEDADTLIINVNKRPELKQLKPVPPMCINGEPHNLVSGNYITPIGGVWTMVGKPGAITANVLDPSKAGYSGKVDTLAYTYKDFVTGCTNVLKTTVFIDTIPQLVTKDTTICAIDPILNLYSLVVSTNQQGPNSRFEWTGEGVEKSGTNFLIDPSKPGSVVRLLTLKYTGTNPAACSATNYVKVTIVPKVTVTAGNYGPLCINGGDVTLGGTPITGPAGQGKWIVPAGGNPGIITTDANGVTKFNTTFAGTNGGVPHKLVYEFSMNGRCSRTDTTEILVNDVPVVDLQPELPRVCIDGANVKLTGMVNGNPAIGGAYTAKNPLDKYVAGNNFIPSRAKLGVNWIYFTYQDFNTQCISKDSASIIVDDTVRVRIKPIPVVCANEPILLEVDTHNVNTIQWSSDDPAAFFLNPKGAKTTFFPSPNQIDAQVFQVTVNVTPGVAGTVCPVAPVSASVTINPKPVPDFFSDKSGCEPFKVTFYDKTLGNNKEWIYDFGDGNISSGIRNPTHTYSKPGLYSVKLTVTNFQGCDSTIVKTNYINVLPKPIAQFDATPSYTTITLPKVQFTDLSKNVDPKTTQYFWDFGDGRGTSTERNPIYSYRDTGLFTVKLRVVNSNGCEDEKIKIDTISIRPEMLVFIPNAFSPNRLFNDKTIRNEEFTVQAMDYSSFEMTIYNRWGEELYYTTDRLKGWDGTYKSAPVQEGVYMYVVRLTSLSGKKYKYTGSITLLR